MIGVHLLVVVRVEGAVEPDPADDARVVGDGENDPRIRLARAHDDGAIDLPEREAGAQVVQAEERPDLRSVGGYAVILQLQGAHVVRDDREVPDLRLRHSPQGLDGL